MTLPSLQHFETFLAVAETSSFTAAAKRLGNSKAAVSQSIRLLEKSLQLPLFLRSTRQVKLSSEGELLLSQCKRLKIELDNARSLITHLNASPNGILRISCNPYFSQPHLLKILQEYMDRFPKVTLEVTYEERIPNMHVEQVDIIIGINFPVSEEVVSKVIGKTRYVLCASPAYLKKFGTPKNIKALAEHRYIPHLGRTSNNIVYLKENIALNLSPQLALNNAYLMKKCALFGLGIVQLHHYIVKKELQSGALVEILKDYLQPEIPLYIYYQKHRFIQPKIRQFINLVTTTLK